MPEEGLSVGKVRVGQAGVGGGVEPPVLREFLAGEGFEGGGVFFAAVVLVTRCWVIRTERGGKGGRGVLTGVKLRHLPLVVLPE